MSKAADGKVVINTQLNNKGFTKGVLGLQNQMNGLKSVLKKLGVALASVFAVKALVDFGKECVELGSDVAEVQNVVDTAFGDMSYKVEAFADTAIQKFGMSRLAAKKTASTYMAMAKGMGLADETASDMAISLAGLTGDVASFYNISQEAADTKLKSVFTGETESLKELGVVMTQTNLKAYALEQGITKELGAMSQAELVALRYGYVMDSLALAQGDFAKTSDSWANQTRILSMQWEEFMSIIGQALITVLTPAVKVLNQIVSGLINIANAFNAAITAIFGGANNQVKETAASAEAVGGAISGAVDNQEDLTEATKETAKAQKKTLAGFDEISKLSDGSSAGGAAEGADAVGTGGVGFDTSKVEAVESGQLSEIQNVLSEIGVTIRNVFNSEPIQTFVDAGKTLFGFFRECILTMLGDIRSNFSLTWGNIQTDFQGLGRNLVALWTEVWSDFSVAVQTWGGPIISSISDLFNSIWATAIDPAIQFIVGSWTDFTGILLDLWNEHGAPLLNNIGEFVYATIGLFQSIYDNVLEPIITPLLETISWLWDKHLSKMVYALGDFIMSLVNGALEIYNKFVVPIVDLLLKRLAPSWASLCSHVIGVVGTIIGVVSDLATGLFEVLTGIVDYIVGIFTGNWEKAWEGIKSIYKGIWDALVGVAKGVINLIIDALNSFVAGINKISFDVPEWVPLIGGMKWGFNIPKIPKLAQGAVIPPNREFMAVLGDQKRGYNIEAPEDLIRQIVREESGGGNTGLLQAILDAIREGKVLTVDRDVFARLVYSSNRAESRRVGVSLTGG